MKFRKSEVNAVHTFAARFSHLSKSQNWQQRFGQFKCIGSDIEVLANYTKLLISLQYSVYSDDLLHTPNSSLPHGSSSIDDLVLCEQ